MRNARLDQAQAGIKLLGEISITSDTQMTPPLWQKVKRNLRASWWRWKRRVKNLASNSTFRKLISWMQPPSGVILKPKKIKSLTVFIVSPFICHEVMGQDAMIFIFWMLSFKPTFPLSCFTFIKRLFSSSLLSAIRVVSSVYLRLLIFLLATLIPACAQPAQHFSWCTLHLS